MESTISRLFASLPPPLPFVTECGIGDISPCGLPTVTGNRGAIMNALGGGGGMNSGGKNGGRAKPNVGGPK